MGRWTVGISHPLPRERPTHARDKICRSGYLKYVPGARQLAFSPVWPRSGRQRLFDLAQPFFPEKHLVAHEKSRDAKDTPGNRGIGRVNQR